MTLNSWRFDLRLTHRWTIARGLEPGGEGGSTIFRVAFAQLTDKDGVTGTGESAPSERYHETVDTTVAFFNRVDPAQLSFGDVAGSMKYLEGVAPGNYAPKCALNIALLDGAARRAGQPIYDYLKLGFTEGKHLTDFSIGIDTPEKTRQKVLEAAPYPLLKLKLGGPADRENLAALREVAPVKRVRVDANEAWKTKEHALQQLEWLAEDGNIELVEQPMPASTPPAEMRWLKARSPLPLMADESYISAAHAQECAECFHAVNVKLVKTGGISGAHAALLAARQAGLKTMIGCMIESSVLITAAAHLAALTDYLDLDGNLLISNDPYCGASAKNGRISFADAPEKIGLRVTPRPCH